jgi:iron uptake system EfeUOB component EfeO/EfeM
LKQIDESTVKYSAKLIGIKDAFSKCQDAYVGEIEAIYKQANDTFRKLDTVSESTRKNIEHTKNNLAECLHKFQLLIFTKLKKC